MNIAQGAYVRALPRSALLAFSSQLLTSNY